MADEPEAEDVPLDPRLGKWPPVCVHNRWLTAFCYDCLLACVVSEPDVEILLIERLRCA